MAKIITVGSEVRKSSFCPQCRKRVPKENRTDKGVKCPRCGFFRWAEFDKYPPFAPIPVPTPLDKKESEQFLDKLSSKKPLVKKEKVEEPKSVPKAKSIQSKRMYKGDKDNMGSR